MLIKRFCEGSLKLLHLHVALNTIACYLTNQIIELEFYRTHTLCALSTDCTVAIL